MHSAWLQLGSLTPIFFSPCGCLTTFPKRSISSALLHFWFTALGGNDFQQVESKCKTWNSCWFTQSRTKILIAPFLILFISYLQAIWYISATHRIRILVLRNLNQLGNIVYSRLVELHSWVILEWITFKQGWVYS